MQQTYKSIWDEKRRRRIGHAQLKREDQLRSQLGGNPDEALRSGTKNQKENAVRLYALQGNGSALKNRQLDHLDLQSIKLNRFDLSGSSLSGTKLGQASECNFNHTTSLGLVTAGGDTSGSSWNGATVVKNDARNSNRRNQVMEGAWQAFNDSRGSDSTNIKIGGFTIGNNHGGETLANAQISGWNILCNYNGAYAPGATITGRGDYSDYSGGTFNHGRFEVAGKGITAHDASFDQAQVNFSEMKAAESANLDHAKIGSEEIAATVEAAIYARRGQGSIPANKYAALKTGSNPAPTPALRLQRRRAPFALAA